MFFSVYMLYPMINIFSKALFKNQVFEVVSINFYSSQLMFERHFLH